MDQLLITSTGVNSITSNACYVFVATSSGLDIFDPDSKSNLAYALVSGGCNDIYVGFEKCYDSNVFIATSLSGVVGLYFNENSSNNITSSISGVYSNPTIPYNNVTCLDLNSSGEFAIGSVSGISYINTSGSVYNHVFTTAVDSCKITQSGDVYYSPSNSGLYVKYAPITSNWSSPDYILNNLSTPSLSGNTVNDIEVVYNSISGSYELFLATNSGAALISENRSNISSSYVDLIEFNPVNNVTGIDLYQDSLVTSGSFIVSTADTNYNGIVGLYDVISGSLLETYSQVDFQSLSGTIEAISGTKVLHKEA